MGCHTWFLRPMTYNEFEEMRSNAISDAVKLYTDCVTDGDITEDDARYIIDCITKSVNNDSPTIHGKYYWYELGYGFSKQDCSTRYIEGRMYVSVEGYNDICRCVYTYPKKVIHSYKQLRKYLRKKWYTSVSAEDKEKLRDFFSKYPGGVMIFG